MALYFTRKHINALMLTKKLRFLGPPTRALPVDPAGELVSPDPMVCSPTMETDRRDVHFNRHISYNTARGVAGLGVPASRTKVTCEIFAKPLRKF